MNLPDRWRKSLPYVIAAVIGIGVVVAWRWAAPDGLPEGIAGGNGRLEATTIDVAAKSGGRLLCVRVREGDFVSAGDEIARMLSVLTGALRPAVLDPLLGARTQQVVEETFRAAVGSAMWLLVAASLVGILTTWWLLVRRSD